MSRGGFGGRGRGFGGGGRGGGFGGGGRGGGFGGRGGRGGRGRGGFRNFDTGPPEEVKELGYYTHSCEDDLVCKVVIEDVPFFNAPIYLQNKQQIGKIDEIFGPMRDYFVSVKLSEDVKANSFAVNQKIYIDPAKLLPFTRFLPNPDGKPAGGGRGRGARGGRGGGRGFGGRGGGRGGRGGFGNRGGGFGGRGGGRGFNRDSGGGRGGGFNRDSGGRGGGFNRDSGGGRGGGFNRDSGGGRGGFNNRGGYQDGGNKRNFDGSFQSQNKRQKFE